jgi:hypothetical protein
MSLRARLQGLGQGLKLGLLLRPRSRPLPPSGRLIVIGLGLHLAVEFILGWALLKPPRLFFWAHLIAVLGSVGLLGLLCGAASLLLRRPGGWLPLCGYLLIALLPLRLLLALWGAETPQGVMAWLSWLAGPDREAAEQHQIALLLLGAWLLVLAILWRLLRWLMPQHQPQRRLLAMLLLGVGGLLPLQGALYTGFWYPDFEAQAEDWAEAAESAPAFDAEALIYAQPRRLRAALAQIPAGIEGERELFAIAFGGDGAEDVFRNEVDYASRLFAEQLGAGPRVLALLNNPATLEQAPLATRTNLSLALKQIGERMNRDEDVLLYLTSHGSEDHQLHVALDPLPLNPIGPEDLRGMLDAAGIRWRILIVSACYSGGFIPALATPETLVITAARADRTSFGCGIDSDFTYFGRALLIQALNQEADWQAAFEQARASVDAREAEESLTPSEPQIAFGTALRAHLATH